MLFRAFFREIKFGDFKTSNSVNFSIEMISRKIRVVEEKLNFYTELFLESMVLNYIERNVKNSEI